MNQFSTVKHIKGPTILLVSGRYFDLLDPSSSDFSIDDIAHALANICRFTGHCRTFYSVAQHSVLVSHAVPKEHAFAGLMHDCAEAIVGDVSKPLKVLLPDYKQIEDRIELDLFARFGVPVKLPECVKHADRVLLRTEQRDLMFADQDVWTFTADAQPLPQRIEPASPSEAKAAFLARYAELRPNGPTQFLSPIRDANGATR
jgi:5'-deoxynucleotidase YfbR-like HD superfamily hydrolase